MQCNHDCKVLLLFQFVNPLVMGKPVLRLICCYDWGPVYTILTLLVSKHGLSFNLFGARTFKNTDSDLDSNQKYGFLSNISGDGRPSSEQQFSSREKACISYQGLQKRRSCILVSVSRRTCSTSQPLLVLVMLDVDSHEKGKKPFSCHENL